MFRYQFSGYHGRFFRTNLSTNQIDVVYDEYTTLCASNAASGLQAFNFNADQLARRNCMYCLPYNFTKVGRIGHGSDQEFYYGNPSNLSLAKILSFYKQAIYPENKNGPSLENAVILSDIAKCWATSEGSTHLLPSLKYKKPYDDIDFNASAIFEESQKYNDCSFERKRNLLFLNAMKEHLKAYYLTNSKSNLELKNVLQIFSKMSLFDESSLFGYDAIVNSGRKDFLDSNAEDDIIVKNMKELAVTFGTEFSFITTIIAACDEYFEKSSGRKRMAYTKMFSTDEDS